MQQASQCLPHLQIKRQHSKLWPQLQKHHLVQHARSQEHIITTHDPDLLSYRKGPLPFSAPLIIHKVLAATLGVREFIERSNPRDGLIGCLEHFKLEKQQHRNQLVLINELPAPRDISKVFTEAPAAFFCSARQEFSAPDGVCDHYKFFSLRVALNRLDYAHTRSQRAINHLCVYAPPTHPVRAAAVCGVIKTQLLIKYHLCERARRSDRLRCSAIWQIGGLLYSVRPQNKHHRCLLPLI